MARMTLEMVARPCISGSVVDSSEREYVSVVANGGVAYESFRGFGFPRRAGTPCRSHIQTWYLDRFQGSKSCSTRVRILHQRSPTAATSC